MIATMNSGISTTKTTVDGSLNITRNSCRMIAQLALGDIPITFLVCASSVRVVVATTGEREVHRLQVRPDDLHAGQAPGRQCGKYVDEHRGRIRRRQPVQARWSTVERQLDHWFGVRRNELLDTSAGDHLPLVQDRHRRR